MRRVYEWDEQLQKGKAGEQVVLAWMSERYWDLRIDDVSERPEWQKQDIDFLMGGKSYEVKTDFLAHVTGRLFLEYEALTKSQADIWLLYIPQRQWLIEVAKSALARYAYEGGLEVRTVQYRLPGGRQGIAHGVAAPIARFLTAVPCTLYTQIGGIEDEQPEESPGLSA